MNLIKLYPKSINCEKMYIINLQILFKLEILGIKTISYLKKSLIFYNFDIISKLNSLLIEKNICIIFISKIINLKRI